MVDLNNPKPVSPLQGMASPTGGVFLSEVPFVGKVNIRGDADNKSFADAVKGVLGVALPTEPNTTAEVDGKTVYWLGPDEWLVHTVTNAEGDLIAALRSALDGVHAGVTDVSDYYVVIDLAGPMSRDVLARGCPLDLHPSVFAKGQCAQSIFAHAAILLHQTSDAPAYRLQVRWTYAKYLWNYLADAAKQWAA